MGKMEGGKMGRQIDERVALGALRLRERIGMEQRA
jgi:hypothetical protein